MTNKIKQINKRIKAVVFDFDGTLVDTFPESFRIFNDIADEYGFSKVHVDDFDELRKLSAKQFFNLFEIPMIKIPFVIKRVQNELHKVVTDLEPIKGLEDVLNILHEQKYVLGVVSSNIEDSILDFLHKHELNMFNFIYAGVLPYTKKWTFKKMFEEQRLNPDETIYVGDEKRDIRASKSVNIPVVSVAWGYSTAEVLVDSEPDYIIQKPSEILSILGIEK